MAKERSDQSFPRLSAVPFPSPADRLSVTAPAILRRIAHHAGPHRIQINVGRHRPRRRPAFHDHALKTLLPKRALPGVLPVEPPREADQQPLHEMAETVHPASETPVNLLHAADVAVHQSTLATSRRQFFRHPLDETIAIQSPKPFEQLPVRDPSLRHRRNLQKDVKMVRHHAVGKHPAAAEVLVHPHEHPEHLTFLVSEHEAPVHHPGNTVIHRRLRLGISPISQPAVFSHTPLYLR